MPPPSKEEQCPPARMQQQQRFEPRNVSLFIHNELIKGHDVMSTNNTIPLNLRVPRKVMKMKDLGVGGEASEDSDKEDFQNDAADRKLFGHAANDDDEGNTASSSLYDSSSRPSSALPLNTFATSLHNLASVLIALVNLSDGGLLEEGDDQPSDALVERRRSILVRYLSSLLMFDAESFASLVSNAEMLRLTRMLREVEQLSFGEEESADDEEKEEDGADADEDNAATLLKKAKEKKKKSSTYSESSSRLMQAANTVARLLSPLNGKQQSIQLSRQALRIKQELSTFAKVILMAVPSTTANLSDNTAAAKGANGSANGRKADGTSSSGADGGVVDGGVVSITSAERIGQHVQTALLPKLTLTFSYLRSADGALVDIVPLRSLVELLWSVIPPLSVIRRRQRGDAVEASSALASASGSPSALPLSLVFASKLSHVAPLRHHMAMVNAYRQQLIALSHLMADQMATLEAKREEAEALEKKKAEKTKDDNTEAEKDDAPDGEASSADTSELQDALTVIAALEAALAQTIEDRNAVIALLQSSSRAVQKQFWPMAKEGSEGALRLAYELLVQPCDQLESGEYYNPEEDLLFDEASPISSADVNKTSSCSAIAYLLPDHSLALLRSLSIPFRSSVNTLMLLDGRKLFHMVVGGGADEDPTLVMGGGGAGNSPLGGGAGGADAVDEMWRRALLLPEEAIASHHQQQQQTTPSRDSGVAFESPHKGVASIRNSTRALLLKPFKYAPPCGTSPWAGVGTVGSPNRHSGLIAANRRRGDGRGSCGGVDAGSSTEAHRNKSGGRVGSGSAVRASSRDEEVGGGRNDNTTLTAAAKDAAPTANLTTTPKTASIGEKRSREGDVDGPSLVDAPVSSSTAVLPSPSASASASLLPAPVGVAPILPQGESTTKKIRFEEGGGGHQQTKAATDSATLPSQPPKGGGQAAAVTASLGPKVTPTDTSSLHPSATASAFTARKSFATTGAIPTFLLGPTANTAGVYSRSGNRPVNVSIVTSTEVGGTSSNGALNISKTTLSAEMIAAAHAAGTSIVVPSSVVSGALTSNSILPPIVSPNASLSAVGGGGVLASPTAGGIMGGGGGGGGILSPTTGLPLHPQGGGSVFPFVPASGVGNHHHHADGSGYHNNNHHHGTTPPNLNGTNAAMVSVLTSNAKRLLQSFRESLEEGSGGVPDAYLRGINEVLSKEEREGKVEEEGAGSSTASRDSDSSSLRPSRLKDDPTMASLLCTCCGRVPLLSPLSYSKEPALMEMLGEGTDAATPPSSHAASKPSPPSSSSAKQRATCRIQHLVDVKRYHALATSMAAVQQQQQQQATQVQSQHQHHGSSGGAGILASPVAAGSNPSPLSAPSLFASPPMMNALSSHSSATAGILGSAAAAMLGGSGSLSDGVLGDPSSFGLASSTSHHHQPSQYHHQRQQFNQSPSAAAGGGSGNGSTQASPASLPHTQGYRFGGGNISGSLPAVSQLLLPIPSLLAESASSSASAAFKAIVHLHLSMLSRMFPLRFLCCGSLQCAECCDVNVCRVCGEEDALPATQREALLSLLDSLLAVARGRRNNRSAKAEGDDKKSLSFVRIAERWLKEQAEDGDDDDAAEKGSSVVHSFTSIDQIPSVVTLAELAAAFVFEDEEHKKENDATADDNASSAAVTPLAIFYLLFEGVAALQAQQERLLHEGCARMDGGRGAGGVLNGVILAASPSAVGGRGKNITKSNGGEGFSLLTPYAATLSALTTTVPTASGASSLPLHHQLFQTVDVDAVRAKLVFMAKEIMGI